MRPSHLAACQRSLSRFATSSNERGPFLLLLLLLRSPVSARLTRIYGGKRPTEEGGGGEASFSRSVHERGSAQAIQGEMFSRLVGREQWGKFVIIDKPFQTHCIATDKIMFIFNRCLREILSMPCAWRISCPAASFASLPFPRSKYP